MFVLHTSNKTENLLAHLHQVIENPLSHPFKKEQLLIQSQGMERWLSQQLADRKGVWANFDFHFPGKFFGNIVDKLVPEGKVHSELYDQESLLWHFDHLLRSLDEHSKLQNPILSHYIDGECVDLKRYQLAEKLAFLFDQYQFMRPDWMSEWEQGRRVTNNPSESWQQDLWHQLGSDNSSDNFSETSSDTFSNNKGKGHLWLDAIEALSKMDKHQARQLLPERLSIFGINGMSPIYLNFLQAIGHFIDVHFYLLNPAQSYWADLPSKKQLAKQRAGASEQFEQTRDPDSELEPLLITNNPLLAALGQQGRDFQLLLLEQCDFEIQYQSFEKNNDDTLLALIQNDILNNSVLKANDQAVNNRKLIATTDNSLSIHVCHSRMREAEVLKDLLLQCLDDDPTLTIRDILVMTPDITQYAPYISAVFEDIPHAIADKNTLDSNNPLSIFLGFLTLSQHRWEIEAVFDVLDQAVVYEHFGLSEVDIENIRVWVAATHIRWGESAQHREEYGFIPFSENSWKAGLERLLMGYANSDDEHFCEPANDANEPVLPFAEIEGSEAKVLGGMYDFISLLSHAKKVFSQPHTLEYWSKHLGRFAEDLLVSTGDYQHSYAVLIELITDLDKFSGIHQQKISLDVILAALTRAATSQQSAAGFLRGQLTFCSMLPMRAIPFKVIALMGMNDGEYPRADTRPAFDLLADDFRKGDKAPRVDERYQFLEVLLSARQQFIMTYVGQSKSNNSIIPPSVVVSELLEYIDEHFSNAEDSPHVEDSPHAEGSPSPSAEATFQTTAESSLTPWVTYHRLQAHSPWYFSDSKQYFTYSSHQLLAAQALNPSIRSINEGSQKWWQGSIENDTKTVIELADLLSFYQHPQRHFIQQQLQINIPRIENRADETEPFIVDGLDQYLINQEWVEHQLAEKDDEGFYKKLIAQGRWLNNSNGIISFTEQKQDIVNFVDQIKNVGAGTSMEALAIDIEIGDYRIVGVLDNQYQKGRLIYRYAKLKGKDLLPVWLSYLIAKENETGTTASDTWLLTKDQNWHFSSDAVNKSEAEELLKALVDVYSAGQKQPSDLLIEPAIAWHEQQHKKTGRISPLQSASNRYRKEYEYDSFFQLIYKDLTIDEVINNKFEEACTLLNPIWENGQKN